MVRTCFPCHIGRVWGALGNGGAIIGGPQGATRYDRIIALLQPNPPTEIALWQTDKLLMPLKTPKSSWVFLDHHPSKSTSSTAQGGGGSFKNRKPIGEVGCGESGMAKRSHWWIERWLISLTLSLSLSFSLTTYLSIYLSIYLSSDLSTYLAIYLSIYLSVCLSICLPVYLSICLSIYLSICLSVYLSICLSICLSVYLSICGAVSFSVV